METDFAEKFITTATPAMGHGSFQFTEEEETNMMTKSMRVRDGPAIPKGESEKAVDVIVKEMAKNGNIAHFEEIKANTELMLGVF